MLIPASVVELDEPDAAFCQSAGEDTVRCERTRLFGFWPVAFIDGFGLCGEVREVGHRRLHPERHLVLVDPRADFWIVKVLFIETIDCAHIVQHRPAEVG